MVLQTRSPAQRRSSVFFGGKTFVELGGKRGGDVGGADGPRFGPLSQRGLKCHEDPSGFKPPKASDFCFRIRATY